MTAILKVTFPLEEDMEPRDYLIPAGTNLAAALMEISPDRWGNRTFALFFGTIQETTSLTQEEAIDVTLEDGHVWHVVVLPGEIITATAITYTASALIAAGVGLATAKILAMVIVYAALIALSIAMSYASSMLFRPKKQTSSASSADDQPTSLNTLGKPSNLFRPTSRIPEIFGRMRTWPDLIFPAYSSWNMVNTGLPPQGQMENTGTTSTQESLAIYALGRGHYHVERYRFGDSDPSTANATIRKYEPGQTLPPQVKLAYDVTNLSRFELGGVNSSNMWSPWYDVPGTQTSEIWVQFHFPSGAYAIISGKKVPADSRAIAGVNVTLTLQFERLDDTGAVVETATTNDYFFLATRNELRQTVKRTVSVGRWRVRAAETNDDSYYFGKKNSYQLNKKCAVESIIGFRELTDQERTFNDVTVFTVTASQRGAAVAQSIEEFNTISVRVLPTQDPAQPPGVLTPAYPNNSWITAAIFTLTDPWTCGYSSNQIDWSSLIAVQNSLNTYTLTENEFNGIFDRAMSADEQIIQVARKARAQVFFSNGLVTFMRDERRTGVSALFNRRNRFAEPGKTGLTLRLPSADEPDGVEVQWIDSADDWRQKTYTYPPNTTPMNPISIDLVGATHSWEVCRRARYEYALNLYRRRTQPIRVTEEAQLMLPFDRVSVVDPWDEGVIDGEVLEQDLPALRLDRVVPDPLPTTARIRLRRADGRETSLHTFEADTVRGAEWIVLTETPSYTLLVPTDDQQLGTLYNISLTDNYEAATHWLVAGVEIDDTGAMLALMEDDDALFQLTDDINDPCADCAISVSLGTISDFAPNQTYVWAGDTYNSPRGFGLYDNDNNNQIEFSTDTPIILVGGAILCGVMDCYAGGYPSIVIEGSAEAPIVPGSDQFLFDAKAIHVARMNDGTYYVNANFVDEDAVLNSSGAFSVRPIYQDSGAISYGEPHGIVAGVEPHDIIMLTGNNEDQYLQRHVVPTGTGNLSPQNHALFATYAETGFSWADEHARLLKNNHNNIGIVYPLKNGNTYANPHFWLWADDLTPVAGPVHINGTYSDDLWPMVISYKRLGPVRFAVLFQDNYSPTYNAKLSIFDSTGALDSLTTLYAMSDVNLDWSNYPARRPVDFAFNQYQDFMVMVEVVRTPPVIDPGNYPRQQLIVTVWDATTMTQFYSQVLDDPGYNELVTTYQGVDLQAKVICEGGDTFAIIYQKFASNTPDGYGVYPMDLKIRRLSITRCEPPPE